MHIQNTENKASYKLLGGKKLESDFESEGHHRLLNNSTRHKKMRTMPSDFEGI